MPDLRTEPERLAAKKDFETQMRQAVMEFDALDTGGNDAVTGGGDMQLDFYEFSRLIREREIGIHSGAKHAEKCRPKLRV